MDICVFEKGFNYSQDGTGNRLVYHLQGCDLHCPWCSNPEGMREPTDVTYYSADEMVEEIISCRPMFFDSGGVTFTGGECSLWAEQLVKVIARVKKAGISVAIESNAQSDGFLKLASLCDIVIADYKHPDGEKLKAVTGADIKKIEANLKAAAKIKSLQLRIPLIHGFNDDDNAMNGFADFFYNLWKNAADLTVEILPYHEYGKEKWEKLGRGYTVENGYVDKETVNKLSEMLKEKNIKVIKT